MRDPRRELHRTMGSIVVLCLAAGLFLFRAPSAGAINTCGDETHQDQCGSASNICICCYWDGLEGNCVWWAWELACRNWGVALSTCANAHLWDDYNSDMHIDSEPCADTIFVCEQNTSECGSAGYGHVGWVLEVYSDGSIRVSEQGCYWFHGTRERIFDAQNASPPMKYIYPPGQTTCQECECTPDEPGQQSCLEGCGVQTRTCRSDCMWGTWSGCTLTGDCAPPDERSCGICGLEQCTGACTWGSCEDPCAGQDGSTPTQDSAAASIDASGVDAHHSTGLRTGCGCSVRSRSSMPLEPLLLFLLVFGILPGGRNLRSKKAGCG